MDKLPYINPEDQARILEGPALTPPIGVEPNFRGSANKNAIAYAVFSLNLVIGTVAFMVRAYSRLFILKKIRLEDGTVYPTVLPKLRAVSNSISLPALGVVAYVCHRFTDFVNGRLRALLLIIPLTLKTNSSSNRALLSAPSTVSFTSSPSTTTLFTFGI